MNFSFFIFTCTPNTQKWSNLDFWVLCSYISRQKKLSRFENLSSSFFLSYFHLFVTYFPKASKTWHRIFQWLTRESFQQPSKWPQFQKARPFYQKSRSVKKIVIKTAEQTLEQQKADIVINAYRMLDIYLAEILASIPNKKKQATKKTLKIPLDPSLTLFLINNTYHRNRLGILTPIASTGNMDFDLLRAIMGSMGSRGSSYGSNNPIRGRSIALYHNPPGKSTWVLLVKLKLKPKPPVDWKLHS